jgi:hypothetical protein
MDKTATLVEATAAEEADTYEVMLIRGSACSPSTPNHIAPLL